MTKAYLIALVKFTNKENFKADYGSKVADVFASFGGHFLVRTPAVIHHEGRWFDMHVVAEFPSIKKPTKPWRVTPIKRSNRIVSAIPMSSTAHFSSPKVSPDHEKILA
jgi:uncharacterized protein (DUF1330 family)